MPTSAASTLIDSGVRWALPPRLSHEDVDRWLSELPAGVKRISIHLGHEGCTGSPGAAERLQAAICLLQRQNVSVFLTVPDATFRRDEEERSALFFTTKSEVRGTEAERTLAYRLPGLLLAQLCDSLDGADGERLDWVKRQQSLVLRHERGVFGHGKSRALAVIGAQDHRTRLRDDEEARQDILENRLLRLLSTPSYRPSGNHRLTQELVEFAYQATENTFDHARRDFAGNLIRQVRTVTIERHHVGTGAGAVALDRVAPDPSSPLRRYLERVQVRARNLGEDPERVSLIGLTVADGGVGVAARMAGTFGVYAGALSDEIELVRRAMQPNGTTKPLSQPGRGRGLVKMLRATRRLDGLFTVRTGRLALSRTYLDEQGTAEHQTAGGFHERPDAFALDGEDNPQVLVAGTTVSVLFPSYDFGPNTLRSTGRRR